MMTELLVIVAIFGTVAIVVIKAANKRSRVNPRATTKSHSKSQRRNDRAKWEKMGRDFEKFVITRFDNREYRLIEWRSDKYIHGWGGPSSSRAPDLLMEHIPSGDQFAIECKYRSRVKGRRFDWARPDQLRSYQDYEAKQRVPVYVAIGIGGEANAPQSLFIVRLERMKFPDVMCHYLEKFRFPAHMTGLEFG
jgi:hypothetical protein